MLECLLASQEVMRAAMKDAVSSSQEEMEVEMNYTVSAGQEKMEACLDKLKIPINAGHEKMTSTKKGWRLPQASAKKG
jgi:hypothetical protein